MNKSSRSNLPLGFCHHSTFRTTTSLQSIIFIMRTPLLLIIYTLSTYFQVFADRIFKKEANQLLSREKRYNRALGEEFRPSNIKRECIEEYCSKEEFFEAMENHVAKVRNCGNCHESYKECLKGAPGYKLYSNLRRKKRFAKIPNGDKEFVRWNCFSINL